MSRLRTAESSRLDRCDTSRPFRRYEPAVGRSRQPIKCMNVDLPEPEGPVSATNSPGSIESETPRSAGTSTSPTWYVFVRSWTTRACSLTCDLPLGMPHFRLRLRVFHHHRG